jgi:hypothetical protein
MHKGIFNLEVGKRYRVKVGAYPKYANWRYGKVFSISNHGKNTTSYFFHESIMNKKYPRKEYFGGYIWTGNSSSSHNILVAEEIILFDTVAYLYSVAPKKLVCKKLFVST